MERLSGARVRRQFEQFAASSSDALLRTAYLMVWDLAEAEDLTQETLLQVARRWRRVHRMSHPLAYARRVLINLAVDGAGRRSRRRQELEESSDRRLQERADESAAADLERIAVRAELLSAIGRLPPRQRAVLVLRYFDDLSEAQAAEALGCSIGTVKSTASRALARLQAEMQPQPTIVTVPNDDREKE